MSENNVLNCLIVRTNSYLFIFSIEKIDYLYNSIVKKKTMYYFLETTQCYFIIFECYK